MIDSVAIRARHIVPALGIERVAVNTSESLAHRAMVPEWQPLTGKLADFRVNVAVDVEKPQRPVAVARTAYHF
jgi:hypothetical protein